MMEKTIAVKIIEDSSKINWEPWILLIATMSLLAAVILPFAQKRYEEYRTKRNFQYYLKKQIGLILNLLTTEKIEYTEPSVKNDPKKELLYFIDYILKIKSDFKEHKNTVQPRVIFMMLMNIQKLCHFSYQLRHIISSIDLKNITEKTLEHGRELSKEELNKIYGLILIYESFVGISTFHDNFDKTKSIKREFKDNVWVGLKVENSFLSNQSVLNEDLLIINDNEYSLEELQNILLIVNQETKKYFDYDNLQLKRKKESH